jgi:hypothetical protein
MGRAAVTGVLLAALTFQEAKSSGLKEARQAAVDELQKLKTRMGELGCKAEASDAESILAKVRNPGAVMTEGGPPGVHPGDDAYEEVLDVWARAGAALEVAYKGALSNARGREAAEAGLFSGWFGSFPEIAAGVRHLNSRRKASGLPAVTADWSASWGGYLHALYLESNRVDPAVKGALHREDPKLADASEEGAAAGAGHVVRGGAAAAVDTLLFSRFRRKPLLDPKCARVAMGGRRWWCVASAPGTAPKFAKDVFTLPGDGDVDVPRSFEEDEPDPFPKGVVALGTVIVVEHLKLQPKGLVVRLFESKGSEVETVVLDAKPRCVAAREPLKERTKYVVRAETEDGTRLEFSFTTR